MNILIFNTLYYPNFVGGAEKSVQNLAEGLLKLDNKVTVVSTTDKLDYSDTINGVFVHYINNKNIYWGFNNSKQGLITKPLWHLIDSYNVFIKSKILEIIKEVNPDIIHTNNISGFSVILWDVINSTKIKVVHTLRDYHLLCIKTTMFSNGKNCRKQCLSCKIYSIPKKQLSNNVDVIVGISKFILDKHVKLGYFKNASKKMVIGNDVGEIKPVAKELNSNNIIFGFIGQLTEAKGIELLISVFSELHYKPNWKLIVAGKGVPDYIDNLKSNYNTKNIDFIGIVNSDTFYKTIDVLVVPSLWNEPFGRVVIEGLKHKKYVIGSRRGGIIDLLPEKALFEPSKEELSNIINDIIVNGVDNQIEEYTDIKVTDKYIEIFNNILIG